MRDPNEQLPEEREALYQSLIHDLQLVYRVESKREHHLARIHERLRSEQSAPQQPTGRNTMSTGQKSHHLQMIATVLVVALVVGSLLLVLNRAQLSHVGSPHVPAVSSALLTSLLTLHMLDDTTGWALDTHAVLRTTNGGQQWSDVTPPNALLQPSSSTEFRTATQAWIATPRTNATIEVFFTSDGGQHWHSSMIPAAMPRQISFVDALHGWLLAGWHQPGGAAEPVSVFRTIDGGQSWKSVSTALFSDTTPPGHLPYGGQKTGISFLNTSTGWVTGTASLAAQSWLYITHDGGSTWQQQSLPIPAGMSSARLSLLSPTFFSSTDGILPVQFLDSETEKPLATVMYHTSNGGTTWQATMALSGSWQQVDFVDSQHGWMTDGTALAMTDDGGSQWRTFSPGTPFQRVSLLDFVNSSHGWAISPSTDGHSSLLETVDSGHTWKVTLSTRP